MTRYIPALRTALPVSSPACAAYRRRPARSGRAAVTAPCAQGYRRVCERIAAHDLAGAAEAMFTHITEAWLVRRSDVGDPSRLER
ncbi:hypothetical protein [Lentzea albidocapillata]|uniref:hypothetical protein n=1 Tax=Lentzea albidocapillata TaxID=40571 RepID=UPI001FE795A0|nr:hypothetical protein [Lentzea albidocapillata]